MNVDVVNGNLLDQDVEAIVNAWNRNIIPWWLLLPQGVSGAIKKRAGVQPFKELPRFRSIPLGDAVVTGAGRLPFKAIIHVAAINGFWRASEQSVYKSVISALDMAQKHKIQSLAFPVLGSGSGGLPSERALKAMQKAFSESSAIDIRAYIVVYAPSASFLLK